MLKPASVAGLQLMSKTPATLKVNALVEDGLFQLSSQHFFNVPREFAAFQDFEDKLINNTHTSHVLDDITYEKIKSRYFSKADNNGFARFYAPMRVDLLKKI